MKGRSRFFALEQYLYGHIQSQRLTYIFVTALFVSGVICGALIVNMLDLTQKEGLTNYLHSFFQGINQGGIVDPELSLRYAMGDNLKTLGIIWLLGLSVIGIPVIMLLLFLKGLVLGFTIGFLFNQLSWKGLGFAFLGVVPQNMIIVPVYIIVVVVGISFAVNLVKKRLIYHHGEIYPKFLTFSLVILGAMTILTVVSFFESYISPILMKYALPIAG